MPKLRMLAPLLRAGLAKLSAGLLRWAINKVAVTSACAHSVPTVRLANVGYLLCIRSSEMLRDTASRAWIAAGSTRYVGCTSCHCSVLPLIEIRIYEMSAGEGLDCRSRGTRIFKALWEQRPWCLGPNHSTLWYHFLDWTFVLRTIS
jgi:hypothetical protein